MVSFQCEACGDVLTKKKLDPHRGHCNWASFTCIDCMVHFDGTAYRAHTSCMTEAEKYEKGLYQPKDKKNNKNQKNQKKPAAASGLLPKPSEPAAPAPVETPAEKSEAAPAPTPKEQLGKRKREDDASTAKSSTAKAVDGEPSQQSESNAASKSKSKSKRKSSSIPSPPSSPKEKEESSATSDKTSQFMKIVKKHAKSESGVSMHKMLKKYYKKLEDSGNKREKGGEKSRAAEEETLWKSLMLKTNDRGEIVLTL